MNQRLLDTYRYTYRVERVGKHRVFLRIVHRSDCRHAGAGSRLKPHQAEDLVATGYDHETINKGHRPDRSMWKNGRCCAVAVEEIATALRVEEK